MQQQYPSIESIPLKHKAFSKLYLFIHGFSQTCCYRQQLLRVILSRSLPDLLASMIAATQANVHSDNYQHAILYSQQPRVISANVTRQLIENTVIIFGSASLALADPTNYQRIFLDTSRIMAPTLRLAKGVSLFIQMKMLLEYLAREGISIKFRSQSRSSQLAKTTLALTLSASAIMMIYKDASQLFTHYYGIHGLSTLMTASIPLQLATAYVGFRGITDPHSEDALGIPHSQEAPYRTPIRKSFGALALLFFFITMSFALKEEPWWEAWAMSVMLLSQMAWGSAFHKATKARFFAANPQIAAPIVLPLQPQPQGMNFNQTLTHRKIHR